MRWPKTGQPISDSFRHLYPVLSEEEVLIARDNFRAYVALALRIYERIAKDLTAAPIFRESLRLRRELEENNR